MGRTWHENDEKMVFDEGGESFYGADFANEVKDRKKKALTEVLAC